MPSAKWRPFCLGLNVLHMAVTLLADALTENINSQCADCVASYDVFFGYQWLNDIFADKTPLFNIDREWETKMLWLPQQSWF